jgi:hypothetical protein
MSDIFQRRDSGETYEVISEDDASVTLRAYDEGHTVSVVSRAEFGAHFDPTSLSLTLDAVTADGAGGVRLACGERVLHLTATQIAAINAVAAP